MRFCIWFVVVRYYLFSIVHAGSVASSARFQLHFTPACTKERKIFPRDGLSSSFRVFSWLICQCSILFSSIYSGRGKAPCFSCQVTLGSDTTFLLQAVNPQGVEAVKEPCLIFSFAQHKLSLGRYFCIWLLGFC